MADSLALEKSYQRNLNGARKKTRDNNSFDSNDGNDQTSPVGTKDKTSDNLKSFGQVLRNARKEAAGKSSDEKVGESIKQLTSQPSSFLLKAAWLNLITTFGLTYIYLAIHFVAAYFMPFGDKIFCKFGQEWIPIKSGPAGQGMKILSKAIEPLEIMTFLFVTAVIFLIIALIFALIGLIGWIWENKVETLMLLGGEIGWWATIKCAVVGINDPSCIEAMAASQQADTSKKPNTTTSNPAPNTPGAETPASSGASGGATPTGGTSGKAGGGN